MTTKPRPERQFRSRGRNLAYRQRPWEVSPSAPTCHRTYAPQSPVARQAQGPQAWGGEYAREPGSGLGAGRGKAPVMTPMIDGKQQVKAFGSQCQPVEPRRRLASLVGPEVPAGQWVPATPGAGRKPPSAPSADRVGESRTHAPRGRTYAMKTAPSAGSLGAGSRWGWRKSRRTVRKVSVSP